MNQRWLLHSAEQVVMVAVLSFLTLITQVGGVNVSDWKAAGVSAALAGLTALKTIVGKFIGSPDSPSWLPTDPPPNQVPDVPPGP